MKNKHIAIAVTNDLVSDQRVHKVAETLAYAGCSVVLIGRRLPGSLPVQRQYKTIRFSLPFKKNFGFYASYNIRLFIHLLSHHYNFYVANDLDTLPACAMARLFTRHPVALDYHELYTEMPELIQTPFQRKCWLLLEKIFFKVSAVRYTVSQLIACELNNRYHLPVAVIRNLPFPFDRNQVSPALSANGRKIILYQGVLNVGRGLEMVIKAMHFIENAVFVIIGEGDIEADLKALVQTDKLEGKVIFTGKIPFENLHAYTLSATLGISLEEDRGINYRYALPNKLFDYIQAGIPVLVSDLPEMRAIVEQYKVGEILKSRNITEFAKQVKDIIENEDKLSYYRSMTETASIELNWEKEKLKLLEIYKPLLT